MRPYGAAGCAVAQGATPTIHQRRAAYHLATATQPRYYLDSLDSIDIWYLVVSINWTAPGPRPLLLDIVYPRLFLSG